MTSVEGISGPEFQALPAWSRYRRLRSSISDKLALLPAVDHNGHRFPSTPAPESSGAGANEQPPSRPPLTAPQGAQGEPLPPAEPTFSEKNQAFAIATTTSRPYAEVLNEVRQPGL